MMATRLRNILISTWYRLTSAPYRLLRRSGLFDAEYYYANNPDVAASGAEPLAHYLTKGCAELRQPGPLFDARYYLHQVPGLSRDQAHPLLHYLTVGRYQGLSPNPLFDPKYYCRQIALRQEPPGDPFAHFLLDVPGDGAPCSPSPYFDYRFYCRKYEDAHHLADAPKAAYHHFMTIGRPENRQPSAYFDTAYYLDKTPSLREAGLDPFSHYLMFGCQELKSPSPLFDPVFYGKTYGLAEEGDLFGHYLCHQPRQERQPCAWFAPAFYRQTYLDGQTDLPPLQHYLEAGRHQGLYPNSQALELTDKPTISILVPVYNVAPVHLNSCIRSVLYQSYPHWELCLADDCSTDPQLRPLLTEWVAADPRIKVVFLKKNGGISAATNAAANLAGGSYLAFLDNDDELAAHALQTFAQCINRDPADLYYSDENLIGADGRKFNIFRKPGFNRELLLCHNYVTHCVVTKKSLFDQVGGCDGERNGAQDLDLFLKLSELADRVVHIPEVLYHWRASASSTSIDHNKKQYADEAGRQSVVGALARQGTPGEALFTDWKFFYRAKRTICREFSISLVITWDHGAAALQPWLAHVLATAGYAVRQLIIAVSSRDEADIAQECGKKAGIDTHAKVFAADRHPGEVFDLLKGEVHGELVAFVSGDLDITGDQWLSALVEYGQLPGVGMVCGRIDYPEGYPDIATPIADITKTSPFYYCHFVTDCSVLMNGRQCPQEVMAISGDLCLIGRDQLNKMVSSESPPAPCLFPFINLSCRLFQQGKKNIYTPYCRATMRQNGIAGRRRWPLQDLLAEKIDFQRKWSGQLHRGNPYYNVGVISDNGISLEAFEAWLAGGENRQVGQ